MKTKNFIYFACFILAVSLFQSCSENPELVFDENQNIEGKKAITEEVEDVLARTTKLSSSNLAKTSNINRASSVRLSTIRNILKGKNISRLNKRLIARCPRSTTADSYFSRSTADQNNDIKFYYTVNPRNRNFAFIVTKMCKSGNKVFAKEYVKDDFPF